MNSETESHYLPARMLNELVYCPRLFYYEHVEGVFVHNQETTEGAIRHSQIDARSDEFPPADTLVDQSKATKARGVMLSSDTHGIVAKMDLVEVMKGRVVPVDYKRGRPYKADDGTIGAWEPDRVQLAAQILVLRDNGYECDEAVVYYATTKQRVRVPLDEELLATTLRTIAEARRLVEEGRIPPPLVDSPKCPRCSLVGICLPDETVRAGAAGGKGRGRVQLTLFDCDQPRGAVADGELAEPPELRRLVPARDDLRPLYLNTQGLWVGKSGNVLKVKEKDKVVQEVRINDICQLNLMGSIQLSTQAIQALCEAEVPIAYFSMGGWFYGFTEGLGLKNIFLRREQFRWADVPGFCMRVAKALVAGKIRNQRTILQRNHSDPPRRALTIMRCLIEETDRAETMEQLLGIEGNGARIYFEHFAGMLKVGGPNRCAGDEIAEFERSAEEAVASYIHEAEEAESTTVAGVESPATTAARADAGVMTPNEAENSAPLDAGGAAESTDGDELSLSFDFTKRNRRPPRDPVNALLSLAYSMLTKDLTIIARTVGLDPYLGFYHQPRFGRPSLALDLMEPFRPLVADSAVLSAINTRMVTSRDFIRAGDAVALTAEGRKRFYRAYEQRMDALVTHPLFGYRVNYRRVMDIQTRLLARVLTGEMTTYPVFVTR